MLELEKQKWDSIKTVGDFLDFIEDPDADILSWMSHNIDKRLSGFWIGARVKFDIDVDRLVREKPQIGSTEISPITRVPAEVKHHNQYKYGNGYNRHTINDDLAKIVEALGFEKGYIKAGKIQGDWREYWRNGQLFKECFFINGLLEGESITYW